MQYRVDPRTGNRLSALGFGCMRLPRGISGIDMKKSEQLILRAIQEGVNYFDTAYLYAGSEAALGSILANNGVRESIYLATKLPIANCRKPEDFDRFFDAQRQALQTGYIDYYLMHNINTMAQWQQLCGWGITQWIKQRQAEGAIRQVGFSFHGSGDDFLQVLDAYDWDFCQIQYNYSDENYQAGAAGLRRAAEKGLPVIIMEPLLGGKLATGLPKQAEAVFRRVQPSLSPAAWGLRWLLHQPEVTVILSGMNQEAQLEDNLHTADTSFAGMLSGEELAAYDDVIRIFRESYKVPCTGCGYCLPCPQNVNIPGCFAAYNASYAMGRIVGYTQYITSTAANRPENRTASRCIGCGSCERQCPQHIAIRGSLKAVEKRLEPFYFKAAMSFMRGRAK